MPGSALTDAAKLLRRHGYRNATVHVLRSAGDGPYGGREAIYFESSEGEALVALVRYEKGRSPEVTIEFEEW